MAIASETKSLRIISVNFLPLIVVASVVVGCRTTVHEQNFSNTFDAPKVAQLSHAAFRVAWDTKAWARHDLQTASFKPTPTDWEVVGLLEDLSRRVGWIAKETERHPSEARMASKSAYDLVAYDLTKLKVRYQPQSFRPATREKIEHLIGLLHQMAPYYAQNVAMK